MMTVNDSELLILSHLDCPGIKAYNELLFCCRRLHDCHECSLDWVLSHWAHFTVLDSFLYCVLLCVVTCMHDCLGL